MGEVSSEIAIVAGALFLASFFATAYSFKFNRVCWNITRGWDDRETYIGIMSPPVYGRLSFIGSGLSWLLFFFIWHRFGWLWGLGYFCFRLLVSPWIDFFALGLSTEKVVEQVYTRLDNYPGSVEDSAIREAAASVAKRIEGLHPRKPKGSGAVAGQLSLKAEGLVARAQLAPQAGLREIVVRYPILAPLLQTAAGAAEWQFLGTVAGISSALLCARRQRPAPVFDDIYYLSLQQAEKWHPRGVQMVEDAGEFSIPRVDGSAPMGRYMDSVTDALGAWVFKGLQDGRLPATSEEKSIASVLGALLCRFPMTFWLLEVGQVESTVEEVARLQDEFWASIDSHNNPAALCVAGL